MARTRFLEEELDLAPQDNLDGLAYDVDCDSDGREYVRVDAQQSDMRSDYVMQGGFITWGAGGGLIGW